MRRISARRGMVAQGRILRAGLRFVVELRRLSSPDAQKGVLGIAYATKWLWRRSLAFAVVICALLRVHPRYRAT
eukprot:3748773-Rhodomonas_salina.1